MRYLSPVFIAFLFAGCSSNTIKQAIPLSSAVHFSKIKEIKASDKKEIVLYVNEGDKIPLQVSIDSEMAYSKGETIFLTAKQRIFFHIIPDNNSIKVLISPDGENWALINDPCALKKLFKINSGEISLGMKIDKNSGFNTEFSLIMK